MEAEDTSKKKCGMGFKFDHQFNLTYLSKERNMKLETLTNSSGHPVRSCG